MSNIPDNREPRASDVAVTMAHVAAVIISAGFLACFICALIGTLGK